MKIKMTMVYSEISQDIRRDRGIPQQPVTWPRDDLHISQMQTQIFNYFCHESYKVPFMQDTDIFTLDHQVFYHYVHSARPIQGTPLIHSLILLCNRSFTV